MTTFRPCIDLHSGRVKQIVGGSLRDEGGQAHENFVSEHDAGWFADRYREDGLTGGHVIMLGPGNEQAARLALSRYPGGLQVGGGIGVDNALEWLDAGASHVIVTSFLFVGGQLDMNRVRSISERVGPDRLVVDLSCRRTGDGYRVATDRWQTLTEAPVDGPLFERLAPFCAEFLVHAVDVEGLCNGIEEDVVRLLGEHCPHPATYAGGGRAFEDLLRVAELSGGRVDLTFGSALDLFGGHGVRYAECVAYNSSAGSRTAFEPER